MGGFEKLEGSRVRTRRQHNLVFYEERKGSMGVTGRDGLQGPAAVPACLLAGTLIGRIRRMIEDSWETRRDG